jgi:hypothetical protein
VTFVGFDGKLDNWLIVDGGKANLVSRAAICNLDASRRRDWHGFVDVDVALSPFFCLPLSAIRRKFKTVMVVRSKGEHVLVYRNFVF